MVGSRDVAELFVGKESEFEDRDRKIIAQGDLEIGNRRHRR